MDYFRCAASGDTTMTTKEEEIKELDTICDEITVMKTRRFEWEKELKE